MKVGELREKLSTLKKDKIIKLASEFYKLIPKAKKEDYDLDQLILNYPLKKQKLKSKDQIVKEIQAAKKQGVKVRENLLNLYKEIRKNDELPQYY